MAFQGQHANPFSMTQPAQAGTGQLNMPAVQQYPRYHSSAYCTYVSVIRHPDLIFHGATNSYDFENPFQSSDSISGSMVPISYEFIASWPGFIFNDDLEAVNTGSLQGLPHVAPRAGARKENSAKRISLPFQHLCSKTVVDEGSGS